MEKTKLVNTLDLLVRIIDIDNIKYEELIEKYSKMSEQETIKELSMISYRVFGNNNEYYDYALNVIRNINPNICPPVEEMKEILERMYSNNIEGNMSLEENHKLVNESIINFTRIFNELDIDYYIVGALPCFLKSGMQLFRYHDDIDIMINESDIEKVCEAVRLMGYEMHDDRFPSVERFYEIESNKPPHTVLAQNPNNEFHIGFFTFRREQDNSITMREYEHYIEDDRVVTDVLERRSDPIGTLLRYDENETVYNGTSFKTGTVENVYHLKEYTKRPKDITDMRKLEPFINFEKLNEIKKHPLINVRINDEIPINHENKYR